MRGFVVGLVIAVLLLGAVFFVPRLLVGGATRTAHEARLQAELARRRLHQYNPGLPLMTGHIDLAALREREAAVAGRLEAALADNRALLSDTQQSLSGVDAGDVAVLPQMKGQASLLEARDLLGEARRLRADLLSRQSDTVRLATQWADIRGYADRYAGMDVSAINSEIATSLEEVQTQLADARSTLAEREQAVRARVEQMEQVGSRLQQLQAQRLDLEQRGFTAGNDSSFESYRSSFKRLSEQMRALQSAKHVLESGGDVAAERLGADLASLDLPLEGEVVGLAELRHRAESARMQVDAYESAVAAMQANAQTVQKVGEQSSSLEQHYLAQLEAKREQFDQSRQVLEDLARQAFEVEDRALRAARDAVSAYRAADGANSSWKRNASDLRQAHDQAGVNQRLQMITRDQVLGEVAGASEALAQTLLGRIHAERLAGLVSYMETFDQLTNVIRGATYDAETLQSSIDTARDAAITALGDARSRYEQLTQQADAPRKWIYQGSLASVYDLLARVDSFNADQHRASAVENIQAAVEGREQSPYLGELVELYGALLPQGRAPAGFGGPGGQEPPDTEEPATDSP